MAFQIIFGNIIEQHVDAVVNPTNVRMHPSGGTDLQIHKAAGPEFDAAVKALGRCEVGEAKITPGFNLPAKYVIHTVGPVWEYGLKNEAEKLASCYKNCLRLAEENGCESIAFPLISAGTYRFPKDQAQKIAEDVIRDYLETHEMEISLVLYDPDLLRLDAALERDLRAAIRKSVREHGDEFGALLSPVSFDICMPDACKRNESVPFDENEEDEADFDEEEDGILPEACKRKVIEPLYCDKCALEAAPMADFTENQAHDLENRLKNGVKTFSDYIFKLIDEKGLTDPEFYKGANMSRQTFSKMKTKSYQPKKDSVVLMALSLKLTPDEANKLLEHAGYSLSYTVPADIVARFYLEHKMYDCISYESAKARAEQGIYKY